MSGPPVPLTSSFFGFTELDSVHYGPGCITEVLPKLLKALGAKKVLLLTGKSLYTKTDVVKKVESLLKSHDLYGDTFYEIGQHSPVEGINKGISAFKACGATAIVSVGGGSPVDAAKVMCYRMQEADGGEFVRQVAIPTTLSAAEYSMGGGYTNEEGAKVAVSHTKLAPYGIILDAELTLSTPERLWLSTGIRALDHAVEQLYRPIVPQPLRVLGYGAIVDLFTYLPASKADPSNVDIRQKLQVASWMSLWPFRIIKYAPLGLSHSLGHKLGAAYSIPHGITSCLTLAPVVALKSRFASAEDRAALAHALVHLREPSTGSVDGDVARLSELIQGLVDGLGLKSSLTMYSVPREDLSRIAEQALGGKDNEGGEYGETVELLERLY